MKKRIIATSSIAVALFLSSFISSQAANYPFQRGRISLEAQDWAISDDESSEEYLGVSAEDCRETLGVDPVFTDSLIQQGFSPSQIQKVFTSAPLENDYNKLPLEE